jgi:hypothetical protein
MSPAVRINSIKADCWGIAAVVVRQEEEEEEEEEEKGRIDGIVARARGEEEIHRREKEKKRSIRFFLFFSFGVIFPVVGSQLSHPPPLFFFQSCVWGGSTLE